MRFSISEDILYGKWIQFELMKHKVQRSLTNRDVSETLTGFIRWLNSSRGENVSKESGFCLEQSSPFTINYNNVKTATGLS